MAGKVPLYIGIGAHRLPEPEQLLAQIQATRQLGAQGFVLFQQDARLATDVLPMLRLGVTREPPGHSP